MIAAAAAALLALGLAAGLVVGRSTASRAVALLLLLPTFALPWVVGDNVFIQGAFTLGSAVMAMKAMQMAYGSGPWTIRRRIWNMLDAIDIRQAEFSRPRFDATGLALALVFGFLAALSVIVLASLDGVPQPAHALLRLLFAAALTYSGAEAVTRIVCIGHALAGIRVPPFQRHPILARSVSDFWSRRWNRVVSGWLNEIVYRPMARDHSIAAAALAAFIVSGLLHGWLFAPLGLAAAAMAALFFVIQGLAMMAERHLHVRRWPEAAARAWTVAIILVPLPLLYGPVFDAIGL